MHLQLRSLRLRPTPKFASWWSSGQIDCLGVEQGLGHEAYLTDRMRTCRPSVPEHFLGPYRRRISRTRNLQPKKLAPSGLFYCPINPLSHPTCREVLKRSRLIAGFPRRFQFLETVRAVHAVSWTISLVSQLRLEQLGRPYRDR
jgi:hypothetical protein